jgi:dTDP-4-dehydrorhamnose reductase
VKVLVTGGTGTLGRELVTAFAHDEVLAPTRGELDIADRAAVHAFVASTRPDAVICSAAMTDVDGCEDDPDAAFGYNALSVRAFAEAAARVGAHLTYVSTDYVFDGEQAEPYTEWDTVHPISVYGASKLAGEMEAGPDAAIVRTSWVCGLGPKNFVATVLRLADHHPTLRFIADQSSRPTVASDLAPAIRRLVVDRRRGTFHVTNDGVATRFDLVQAILPAAGRDPGQVLPIPAAELTPPQKATRPTQSVLDNAVLRIEGAPPLPDWRESLPAIVAALLAD